MARFVYVTPDFASQYQAKTGKAPGSSILTEDDFGKMAGEAGLSGLKPSYSAPGGVAADTLNQIGTTKSGQSYSTNGRMYALGGSDAGQTVPDYEASQKGLNQAANQPGQPQSSTPAAGAQGGTPTNGQGGKPPLTLESLLSEIGRGQTAYTKTYAGRPDLQANAHNFVEDLKRVAAANGIDLTKYGVKNADGIDYRQYYKGTGPAGNYDPTQQGQAAVANPTHAPVQWTSTGQMITDKLASAAPTPPPPPGGGVGTGGGTGGGTPGQLPPPQLPPMQQAPSFADWLKSIGLTLPAPASYQYNPQAAYDSASADAELAVTPQRELLNMLMGQKTTDQTAKNQVQHDALIESQARRRLFTSPIGLSTEQDQIKGGNAALGAIGAEKDQKLRNLEFEKANRIQAGLQKARGQASDDFFKQQTANSAQFGNLTNLYGKSTDAQFKGQDLYQQLQKMMGYGPNGQPTLENQLGKGNLQFKYDQLDAKSKQFYDKLSVDDKHFYEKLTSDDTFRWTKLSSDEKFKTQDLILKSEDLALKAADSFAKESGYYKGPDGKLYRTVDGRRLDINAADQMSKQLGIVIGEDGRPITGSDGNPIPTLEGAKFDWQQKSFIISENNKVNYQNATLALQQAKLISDAQGRQMSNSIAAGRLSLDEAKYMTSSHETARHNQATEQIQQDAQAGKTADQTIQHLMGAKDSITGKTEFSFAAASTTYALGHAQSSQEAGQIMEHMQSQLRGDENDPKEINWVTQNYLGVWNRLKAREDAKNSNTPADSDPFTGR